MANWKIVLFWALAMNLMLAFGHDDQSETILDSTALPNEQADPAEVKEEAGVLVLTDKNFDSVVNSKSIILVEFYAPWCGHCKQLAPQYAEAAQKLKEKEYPVSLAKVDCTTETNVASRFNIQGYPTLKVFRNGKDEEYEGPREAEGIVQHMSKLADPNYEAPPEAVLTLSESNFTDVVNAEDIILVEFYAPWCGHCKKLAPELEKAAQVLANREKPIKIAKVDAVVERKLGEQYGVSGYPTMKLFRKGEASEYKGGRTKQEIIDYMVRHEGPPSTLYDSLKAVKDFIKSNLDEPVMLGVFSEESDPMLKLYYDANNDVRDDFKFGHTFSSEAKKHLGLTDSAILVIHPEHLRSKYEPKYHILKDKSSKPSDVLAFYKKHQVPLVGNYQTHTDKRFAKRPLVLVFYDVDFLNLEMRSITQYWRGKVVEVAKDFPNALFAVAEEGQFLEKLKEAGLAESGEEVNVILYDEDGRRYAMEDEFSEDSLTEFVQAYFKGKLKPVIKSQIAPKKQSGHVKVVVGSTFDQIVKDETKEVLIEFYAPWCGHCKAMENTYNDLAEKYKDHKDLIIAKIDGTANEGPSQYPAQGFPTIYWAPPGKKSTPVSYSGERTLEAFVKFLEENSKILGKSSENASTSKKEEL